VDRVHISVDRPGVLGPPWTDGGADRGGARIQRCADLSSASGRSDAPKLTGGGAKGREEHGELGSGLTGARLRPHRSSGGAVEAGRRWCRTGRRWRSVRTLRKRGERGKEAREGVVLLGGGARLL
jgi:hypothetical protein